MHVCDVCCVTCRYGLTPEQQAEAEAAYEQMVASVEAKRAAAAAEQQQHQQQHQALPADCNILGKLAAGSSGEGWGSWPLSIKRGAHEERRGRSPLHWGCSGMSRVDVT